MGADVVLTRATGVLLTVAGLTLVLVGVMLGVLLGSDGEWSAQTRVPAGRSAVVVGPALASVLGPSVTVSAHADGGVPLFLGRARVDDAMAFVKGTSHAFTRSLLDGHTLRQQAAEGQTPLVDPGSVDIWQQESVAGRSLAWTPTPGAQAVVISTATGTPLPAVDLAVSWRDGSWRAIPALAVLVGSALLALARLVRR